MGFYSFVEPLPFLAPTGLVVLPPGPKDLHGFLQFIIDDVGVDLGGGDLGPAQGLLGEADVFGLA